MLRKLAGQTAIYGISTIAAKLLNYLLVPYTTRVMGTMENGQINDMYSWMPFILVLLTMGLETGFFRFAGKAESVKERNAVFASTWGMVTAVALLFFAAVMLFTPQIAEALRYAEYPSYIRIMGAIITLDAIMAVPFSRLRQEGRPMRFLVVRMLSVVVNVVFVVFFYSGLPRLAELSGIWSSIYNPDFGVGYFIVANLIASAVTLIALYPSYKDAMPRINWRVLRPILIYSFPLLLSGIVGTANMFIDRQMIKWLMPLDISMDALGIYGTIIKIGALMTIFTQVYRMGAEPFFLSSFKKDDFLKLNAEALKFFAIISIGIFLLIMLYDDLFVRMVGPEFREGVIILPMILLANMFSGLTFNLNFWFKQADKTSFAILITSVGLIFTITLNVALIPVFGYVGAAWARLGCEVVMLAVSYFLNQKYYHTPYDVKRISGYFLIGSLIYITTYFTNDFSPFIKYPLNLILLLSFARYAIFKENIALKLLIKSFFAR